MIKKYFILIFGIFQFSSVIAFDSKPSVIQPLAEKSLLLDIERVGSYRMTAVGERGHILSSGDGHYWQQIKVQTQATLTKVYFLDDKIGWAIGHNSTILATQDAGLTWKIQQSLPHLQKPLFDIVFKSKLEGVAIGSYGQFYRTSDGGNTWNAEFHQEFLPAEDIEYLAELELQDEEAYIDEINSILPHFNRILMDGRTLFISGEAGVIAKSNDFGKTWKTFEKVYQGSFFDITRTPRGNLLAAGLRGNVFRSTNNGKDWQLANTATTALINAIIVADDDRIFLLGNNGTLLESVNDGITFHKIRHLNRVDKSHLISGVMFHDDLIAVSSSGIKRIEVSK